MEVGWVGRRKKLMAKVKEKDPEKINSAYLIEIIDRMF